MLHIKNIDARYSLYYMQLFAFNLLGIDVLSKTNRTLIRNPFKLALICVGLLISFSGQYCYILSYYKDVFKVADGLLFFFSGVMVFIKSLVFLIRRKRVNQIMEKLNEMSKQAINSSPKERAIWITVNRREQRFGIFYFVLCIAVSLLSFLQPLIDVFSKYIFKQEIQELKLPFQGIYFYDVSTFQFYLLTCICNFLFLVFMVSNEVGIDTTFSWFIHNINVHFRILHVRLEHISKLLSEVSDTNVLSARYKLGKVLDYHKEVLNIVALFDEAYCPNIFVQVVYSCIQLFVCIFLSRVGTGASFLILAFTSTSSVLMQCMFYCFGGQWIQNESEAISNDFYLLFPWSHMHVTQRRSIMLAMLRSQKLSVLSAYFFIADSNLFVMILKAASSFVALFRAIKDNE